MTKTLELPRAGRTENMEPDRPSEQPARVYDGRPVASPLVIALERGCRTVGNDETQDGTESESMKDEISLSR